MTEEGRKQKIKDALEARESEPGEKDTETLPWRGSQKVLPVVELELDVPLLNPRSNRLQAKLEGHEKCDLVREQPWSDEAQEVVSEILRERHRNFAELKDSLRLEGQTDPGVVTRDGILVNANSRLVALRDLDLAARKWIKVAVLPPRTQWEELQRLELALQVQNPLKDEYQLTEQLLFIEKLARDFNLSAQQIARDLRWSSDDGRSLRRGGEKVDQRRRILKLIREMQSLTDPPLPLTFFDDKLEQLQALEKRYHTMLDDGDVAEAQRFRLNWLAAALAGLSSVHNLRSVDEDFVEEYLLPRMEEDEDLLEHAEILLAPSTDGDNGELEGLDELGDDGDDGGDEEESAVGVQNLLNLLASSEATVTLPGSDDSVDREEMASAVVRATKGAIKDQRSDQRAENELDAPVSRLRDAVRQMRQADEAYRAVCESEEFDQSRRGRFQYQLKQARKAVQRLEKHIAEESGDGE